MAEFRLPANSKVKIGNTHSGPKDAADIRAFKVYRYDPDSNERLDWIHTRSTSTTVAQWYWMLLLKLRTK